MNLVLNKNSFVNNLLNPVSKLADNLLLEFDESNTKAKTLVSSSDNSVIFLGEVSCKSEETTKCVIPDCKTFLRLFSNIESDNVSLKINKNSISYKDTNTGFSFKYHLLDESYIVNKKTINENKLNELNFDTSCVITKQKLSEIVKFNSIVPDAEKLYFLTEKTKILAKLGDEQKANTNEILTTLSETFTGSPITEPIPIHIQNLLLFSFFDENITISINHQLKVLKFESQAIKYIVSGLVK